MPEISENSSRGAAVLVCNEVWGGNRGIDAAVALPGLRGWLHSRPAGGGRGGDVHYLSVCGSGLLSRMCVADVAGHGETVAAIGQEMHDLFRRHINWLDQRALLAKLNERLIARSLDSFATAAAATYYPPSLRLSLSYAGHPPAWFYHKADRQWLRVPPSGAGPRREFVNLPLAVEARTVYTRRNFRVAPGDRLLLLTDGILESPDAEGRRLGDQRVHCTLTEYADAPVSELVARLSALASAWSGPQPHDDETLLMVEFEQPPPGPALWHVLKNRVLRVWSFRRPVAAGGA